MVKLETKISHTNEFIIDVSVSVFLLSSCNKCWYISRLILINQVNLFFIFFIYGVHVHCVPHTYTQV